MGRTTFQCRVFAVNLGTTEEEAIEGDVHQTEQITITRESYRLLEQGKNQLEIEREHNHL